MIRKGTFDDLPAIVEMAREFWNYTIYDDEYCPSTVHEIARQCVEQGLLSVVEIGGDVVGFACGVTGPLLGNASVKCGTEIAWWVNPEHRSGRNGVALLKHIEGLARDAGVKYWNMAYMQSSMPETVEAIYEKMGYTRTEVIYTRVL